MRTTRYVCAVDAVEAVNPPDWFEVRSAQGGIVDCCSLLCVSAWALSNLAVTDPGDVEASP